MFWEAKIFLKCDFAKKYSILFYILCGFWKFSRYHSQLSILCSVSFYEYHKNSFENFRTDVKIGIFPIPIELWSGFGFSSKIGRIPTRSGCLDSLHRHTTFMASFTCLRLTRLNEFRCRFLLTSFKFSIVFFSITVGHASRDRNKIKQRYTASYCKLGCDNSWCAFRQTFSLPHHKLHVNF